MWILWSVLVCLIVTYVFVDHVLRIFKVGNYGDRYVFVTGCDSGFGRSLATRLDGLGLHVFAGCLTEDGREYLSKNCSKRLVTVLLDVTQNESIEAALQLVKRTLPQDKGLWGLVNNAGIFGNPGISELCSKEDYLSVFAVDLLGPIEMTRHFLPLIRKSRGRVVNCTSACGRLAFVTSPYTLAKHGLEAYSDILRRELFHRGIKVCIVEPGGFQTQLTNMLVVRESAIKYFKERATDDIKEFYGDLQKTYTNFFKPTLAISTNISLVVDAYTHALTSRYPRTRYSVGPDAKFVLIPMSYLPTWLSDRVFAKKYH